MTNLKQLSDQKREFLVIKHRGLNKSRSNFEEETRKIHEELANSINQRAIIPGFEGDYMIPSWSNDVIMVHSNFPPSKRRFDKLRKEGCATYLYQVLEDILRYKKPQDIAFVLEAKFGTNNDATFKAIQILQSAGIQRAYFDSFFGNKFEGMEIPYPVSLHLIAKIGSLELRLDKKGSADIIAIPYPLSFKRHQSKPLVYGAIKNKEQVETVSKDPNVLGVFWRGKTSVVNMFLNQFAY